MTTLLTPLWAQVEMRSIIGVAPAVTFSWYPYATENWGESTKTTYDRNNFGMSFNMGLKLYDKISGHINLKIDEPTMQNLIDFAGYLSAFNFLLKFDYHTFGGTVTWAGDTPNPIPGGISNFRNQWSIFSLMFRLDQIRNQHIRMFINNILNIFGDMPSLWAIGIGYARFDMPLEYRLKDSTLTNHGFGLVEGYAWGITMLWDTLTWSMENRGWLDSGFGGWLYIDVFWAIRPFGSLKTDANAIAWISNANNGVYVNGNFEGVYYGYGKAAIGLQYVWDIGRRGRIGIAVGLGLLDQTISTENNDIFINYFSRNFGPAMRLSACW